MEAFEGRPSADDLAAVSNWTLAHLRDLVRCRLQEGLHIEFKEGDWLVKPEGKDRGGELRRQVAGLANAEGGVLVVGIGEHDGDGKRRRDMAGALAPIIGYRPQGGLAAWSEETLRQGVYPALQPSPKIHVLADDEGQYLVISVMPAKAPLTSVRCDSRDVFPARIGGSTVDLDEWAVRAILLGTRQQPYIAIGDRASTELRATKETIERVECWVTTLKFCVFNESLLWVNGLRWGVVFPGLVVERSPSFPGDVLLQPEVIPLTPDLSRHLSVVGDVDGVPRHVVPNSSQTGDLAPFEGIDIEVEVAIPTDRFRGTMEARFAVYVLGKNLMPQWFESLLVLALTGDGFIGIAHASAEPPIEIGFAYDRGVGPD